MHGIGISGIILLILLAFLLVGAHFIPVFAEKICKAIHKRWTKSKHNDN